MLEQFLTTNNLCAHVGFKINNINCHVRPTRRSDLASPQTHMTYGQNNVHVRNYVYRHVCVFSEPTH